MNDKALGGRLRRAGRGIDNPYVGLAIAIGSILGTPTSGFAQDERALEEVVVTARFREENLQQTPIPITALSADELTEMGFQNMSEIGRAVPNAYFRQQSGPYGRSTQVYIRGIGQGDFQFSQEPRTSTYIDDVYFATVFGSMLDLLDLERVEVLRGPQGTLFGRNAMGGAVRMVSRKPEGGNTGSVQVAYGDFERLDLRGSFDQTLVEDKLFLRVAGSAKRRTGHVKQIDFTCDMIARGTPQLAGLGDGMVRLRDPGANGIVEPSDPYLPDRLPPAQELTFNPYYVALFGTDVVGDALTAYGVDPGPNGDYPQALNPGIDPTTLATLDADDDALSFPQRRDTFAVGGTPPCELGTFGGEDVQAMRASLRWLASDRAEVNLSAFYIWDDSETTGSHLFDIGNGIGLSNTVPGTTTGIENLAALNDAVNLPRWGIPYDSRFITTPYRSYATFDDKAQGQVFTTGSKAIRSGVSVVTDFAISDRLQMKWVLASHGTDGDFANDRDQSPLTLQNTWNTVEADESSTELRFSGLHFDGRLDWTAGAFYWEAGQDNGATVDIVQLAVQTLPFPPFNGPIVPLWNTEDEADSTNRGAYLHTVYHINDRLDFSGGVRWSKDEKHFIFRHQFMAEMDAGGEEVDYKLGIDYQVGEDRFLYTSVATGYTASSFNARPFDPAQFISQPQEDLTNYEFGYKSDLLDSRLRFNANLFYADYATRVIGTATEVQASGIPLTLPVTSPAQIAGLEFEINGSFGQGFFFGLNGGFMSFEADEIEGNGAPGLPQRQFSANAMYEFGLANGATLTPRLDWFYTDDIYFNVTSSLQQKAYSLVNARLTYQLPDADWSLGLEATNLLDEEYYLAAYDLRTATINTGVIVPARPREWAISLRHDF
jgi:outer membrane receptor protein involved in Fe transport